MTDPDTSRHVEIKDGDQTVAAAEVATSQRVGGTAQASLRAASGHIAPGSRASLVDAVMDLPEVQQSARLKAAVPLGDTESLASSGLRIAVSWAASVAFITTCMLPTGRICKPLTGSRAREMWPSRSGCH